MAPYIRRRTPPVRFKKEKTFLKKFMYPGIMDSKLKIGHIILNFHARTLGTGKAGRK